MCAHVHQVPVSLTSLGYGLPEARAKLDLACLLVDTGDLGGAAQRQLAAEVVERLKVDAQLCVLALVV